MEASSRRFICGCSEAIINARLPQLVRGRKVAQRAAVRDNVQRETASKV